MVDHYVSLNVLFKVMFKMSKNYRLDGRSGSHIEVVTFYHLNLLWVVFTGVKKLCWKLNNIAPFVQNMWAFKNSMTFQVWVKLHNALDELAIRIVGTNYHGLRPRVTSGVILYWNHVMNLISLTLRFNSLTILRYRTEAAVLTRAGHLSLGHNPPCVFFVHTCFWEATAATFFWKRGEGVTRDFLYCRNQCAQRTYVASAEQVWSTCSLGESVRVTQRKFLMH